MASQARFSLCWVQAVEAQPDGHFEYGNQRQRDETAGCSRPCPVYDADWVEFVMELERRLAAGGGREARYFAHQGFGSLADCRPE